MLRNLSNSSSLADRQSSSCFAADPGGSSRGQLTQESPWLGLFSTVSRPALSVLQKFFPEHPRTSTQAHNEAASFENVVLSDFERLSQRNQQNLVPDSVSWMSTGGLRDLGIDCVSEVELNFGHHEQARLVSSQRTLVSFVSSQDAPSELLAEVGKTSQKWFGRFLGAESPMGFSSGLFMTPHCPEKPGPDTKPTSLRVENLCCKIVEDTSSGLAHLQKAELDWSAASSHERLLTPEQEHGYASLEDLPVQHSGVLKETPLPQDNLPPSHSADEESQSKLKGDCRNKAIAFIMGLPCSDDDDDSDSQSDDDDDDDDDDDGFDSQGSSQLSDSSDEDGDDCPDGNSDSERLWTSFFSTEDPYNPRNFTALQHTSCMLPQAFDTASANQSCEQASCLPSSSPTLSSSPPCGQDSWDDSTSASDDEETASARLHSLFSSSDPYNPFNFQAPVRTQQPTKGRTTDGPGASSLTHLGSPCPAAAPEWKRERSKSTRTTKKVHFCEDVVEFFAGSVEEDRKGPWEELARDRCRFLRRCQEVELNISYCLQPQHRNLVYFRIVSEGET